MAWSAWEKGLLDAACVLSGVGIWPRFIEPRWVEHRHLILPLAGWRGQPLNIAHLSDLHFGRDAPENALQKALEGMARLQPDLVLWTGDFLVDAETHNWGRLAELLSLCRGRYGTYACLGNHDYSAYVSVDGGHMQRGAEGSRLLRILRRLLGGVSKPVTFSPIPPSDRLLDLLAGCGIELLHNESKLLTVHGLPLQIGGIGDLWAGHATSLQNAHSSIPSLLLAHNPDCAFNHLLDWTAVLSGHTHGRQINLPLLGKKLCNAHGPYTRGLYPTGSGRWVHVSRGLGCSLPFRIASRPEVSWLTLMPT